MTAPIVIGLCGRSGTGKGYVAGKFLAHGIPSVDTDAVYRDMTGPADSFSPCMQELIAAFGNVVACDDHSLNRRVLSAVVFANGGEAARRTLNTITHAHILRETKRRIAVYGDEGIRAVLIDAPLLFESGFDRYCHCTVCVTAPTDVSVQRILRRDGITKEEAERRLASQIPSEELICRCDYHIENGLNCDTLDAQVANIAHEIFSRFSDTEAPHGQ